ncbi:hypothetical protein BMS3Abin04_00809 [bacterium BMS3Abin04]|nr:hypothetical protein BMS3Abin04_00809 [bacterium BMS3Abin04]
MRPNNKKHRLITEKLFPSTLPIRDAFGIAFFYLLLAASSLLLPSCNTTEPPIDNIKPGRRDYTWKVDTLFIPSTYLFKMWGNSPSDVWAVGPGGSLDKTIWHYDGNKWKTDGVSRSINPWTIYGFSADNVWIAGEEGRIWHYNGTKWSQNLWYKNSHFSETDFLDIWGESPNDIYAVGLADSSNIRLGLMLHYNGNNWKRVNIGFIKGILMKIRKGSKPNSKYFLWNQIQNNSADSTKYFIFENNKPTEIYHHIGARYFLTVINNEVIFTFDNEAYTYSNNTFNLIAKNPYPNNYTGVYGRSVKDIIWMMADGLTHFNGSDFKYILKFNDLSLSDGAVFNNDIFFLANNFNNSLNNLIYHGILK